MTILHHWAFDPMPRDGTVPACGAQLLRTRRPGRLVVKAGRAWITRRGDLDDHVLAAGESIDLRAGERVVVEPWDAGKPVQLSWCGGALAGGLARTFAARALRLVARASAAAGERLLALGRSAAASAGCAQGVDTRAAPGACR